MAARKSSQEIKVSLGGPGIKPDTVDTLKLLRLAEAYFSLLTQTAQASGLDVVFRGIRVRPGSAALAAVPNDISAAVVAAKRTQNILKGREAAPAGTVELANRIGHMVRGFPDTQTPKVVAGKFRERIEAPIEVRPVGPWEVSEFRAQVIRVGGSDPQAWFFSPAEPQPFALHVTQDLARKLGSLLYLPVDVEARFYRDSLGKIERGTVTQFHRIDDASPVDAWREWYRENAAFWDEVNDVETELGRRIH